MEYFTTHGRDRFSNRTDYWDAPSHITRLGGLLIASSECFVFIVIHCEESANDLLKKAQFTYRVAE